MYDKTIPPIEERVLKQQQVFFGNDIRLLDSRRNQWIAFEILAKNVFKKATTQYQKKNFAGNLFYQTNNSGLHKTKNKPWISLQLGGVPTGIQAVEYHPDLSIKKIENSIERGGSVTYSQLPNGMVACMINGARSDLSTLEIQYFLYKRYSSPSKITKTEMWKAIIVFFWYARITSYSGKFTILDLYKLFFFRVRSKSYTPKWNIILSVTSTLIAFLALIVSIKMLA